MNGTQVYDLLKDMPPEERGYLTGFTWWSDKDVERVLDQLVESGKVPKEDADELRRDRGKMLVLMEAALDRADDVNGGPGPERVNDALWAVILEYFSEDE